MLSDAIRFVLSYNVIIYSGFHKDPKENQIELHVFVPKDSIVGKYVITGKILLLPIAGQGDLTFIFGKYYGNELSRNFFLLLLNVDDMEMVVKIKTKVETRSGEDYMKIKSVYCDTNVKK